MSHVFLPYPSLEFAFQHGKPSAQAAFKRVHGCRQLVS